MFAQILGILAMIASCMSFQMRTHKSIMIVQIITAALFAAHYWLLGTMTACILNAAAIVRNFIFLNNDKKVFASPIWTVLFAVVMVILGAFTWEGPVSILFMVAMVLNTVSLSMKNPQNVRKIILVASPLACIYNIISFSIGGIANETLVEISTIIALYRYRKAK